MDSSEIEDFIKKHIDAKNSFKGIFASNFLTKIKLKKHQSIIVNNCNFPQETLNCHWCLCINNGKEIYWFDSYGVSSYNFKKSIYNFVKKHKKIIKNNRIRLQSDFSVKCGQFCCICLYMYYKNMKIPNLKQIFDINDLRQNDIILDTIFEIFKNKKVYKRKNKIK